MSYPPPEVSVTCPEGHEIAECTRRHLEQFSHVNCSTCGTACYHRSLLKVTALRRAS